MWLIITYILGCGLGMGMIYGCNISNAVKFFPDKKGIAGGLTTACYGISSVIIPPIANALNQGVGVTMSFKILGLVFLVIICLGGLMQMKCPEDFIESFDLHTKVRAAVSAESVQAAPKKRDYAWNEMLKTPYFYLMLFMLTCGAVSGPMCISQASGMAVSIVTFYCGICLIGIIFGSFMGAFPAFTAKQFGAKNNSMNFGIMFIGFAVAGYVGPTIMKSALNSTGSYNMSFILAAILAIGGIAILMFFKTLQMKNAK